MKESDSLTYLKVVGEKRAALFRRLGIENVGDLLPNAPLTCSDRANAFEEFFEVIFAESSFSLL